MSVRQSGFTLLEALLAAAVLAGVSVLLTPALIGAMSAAARTQGLTSQIEMRAALDGAFRELFESSHQPGQGDTSLAFSGGPRNLRFLTRPAGADPMRAELALSNTDLTLTLTPVDPERRGAPTRRIEAVLAEGFENASLSYIGIRRNNWRQIERDQWSEDYPPRLVRLRLTWPDGEETVIHALVRGDARFDCRFDSGRGLCLGDSY